MKRAIIILLALIMGTCSTAPSSLEEVLATGQLRIITRNAPTTFYRGPFGYEGPEYDLAQEFRSFLENKYQRPINLQFQQANRIPELFSAVESGSVHIAAAGLTVTADRAERVAFGPSYKDVSQYLVYRLNSGRPRTLEEIQGKRLEIVAGTSFAETLQMLRGTNPALVWSEHPKAETGDLLRAVQEERLDYTVVDSIDYYVHRYYMPDLRKAIKIAEGDKLAWAFDKMLGDELASEAELFFATIATDGTLNRINERYYGHTNRFDYVGTRTFKRHYKKRLNRYRDMFVQAGIDTETDWRLLAAIGYQESHWNPKAVSPTGVRGLMMLTRSTAGGLGVKNRTDPAQSIEAGARYFMGLYNRLHYIPHPDRIWFALAAYNVGYGHLQDARTLAIEHDLDPNRWVHIKEMLPLLSQSEYYSRMPHGYARGWEPVRYVNNVRTYYEILTWLTLDDNLNWPNEFIQTIPDIQTAAGIGTTNTL